MPSEAKFECSSSDSHNITCSIESSEILIRTKGTPREVANVLKIDKVIIRYSQYCERENLKVNDYVESLISGRLHTQLYQMSYNFPFSILILEGTIEEVLMERKIRREVYISSLAGSLYKRAPDGAQGVINLVCLSTPYDTALFIKFLHEKAENYEPRLPKLKRYKMSEDEQLVTLLSTLPGVGEKRAEKLLKRFGSLKNLVNASYSEIASVDGVPSTVAKKIYQLFNKKFNK